jgi:hypothetical protein
MLHLPSCKLVSCTAKSSCSKSTGHLILLCDRGRHVRPLDHRAKKSLLRLTRSSLYLLSGGQVNVVISHRTQGILLPSLFFTHPSSTGASKARQHSRAKALVSTLPERSPWIKPVRIFAMGWVHGRHCWTK